MEAQEDRGRHLRQREGGLLKQGFAEEALPHLDAVYRFALRLCGGRADRAEDVAQETFLRAYRAWESYRPGTSCRSWLFTICRNVFLRQKEQRSRRPEYAALDVDADAEALAATAIFDALQAQIPETAFFDSFVDQEVLDALDRLPDDFREPVTLSDLEGLSYGEIAQILGVPVGTVKSRIFRGRRLLRQALCDYAVEMGYLAKRVSND
ncbi:MAG: sigma-70 family RNA polymerase sigma factor [Gemmatimonadetes bacterium]|nr:sigma-70 family RNA polymerase sigma factor [Gemmatimonadota bacterium]